MRSNEDLSLVPQFAKPNRPNKGARHQATIHLHSRGRIAAMRLLLPSMTFAQETVPSRSEVAEVERVIVTGSNIPTAEETGPNPVDTYRPADLEKLGIRNAQDLQTFLPQEAGGTVNLNIGNGGDGQCRSTCGGCSQKKH